MSLPPSLVATCLLILSLAPGAQAADLYFSSNLLISGGTAQASGSTDNPSQPEKRPQLTENAVPPMQHFLHVKSRRRFLQ